MPSGHRALALLAALALVAAAFFANLLVTTLGGRLDLTEDRTFTLSPASRRLVGKLDEPVKLELFVSRADVKLGAYRESYARRVETLLRQYAAASGGKLRLVVTDPKPDTKDEQRAQRHGLNAIRTPQGAGYLGLGLVGHGAPVYLLVAIYGLFPAFTDGVGKAWVSSLAGTGRQATAQGVFQGGSGFAVLIAGIWAGLLWGADGRLPLLISGVVGACFAVALLGRWAVVSRTRVA